MVITKTVEGDGICSVEARFRHLARPLRRQVAPLLLLATAPVGAGEWDFTPRIGVSEVYTDNIFLNDTDEQSDLVTEITPGLSIRGLGPRMHLNLDYNAQNLVHINEGDQDTLNHQLQTDSNTELIEDLFFLDTSASIFQQVIDSQGRVSRSNISSSGNRGDVITHELSPYFTYHLGGYADTEIRYSHGTVTGNQKNNSDVTRESVSVSLNSGDRFARVPWSFNYRDSENTRADNQARSSTFKVTEGIVSYVFNRKISVNVNLGTEDNMFASSTERPDGFFWNAGATWTPNSRTSIEAAVGNRFFGTNYTLDATYRRRKLTMTATYNETAQDSSGIQQEFGLVPLLDINSLPIFDPVASTLIDLPESATAFEDDTVIRKRLNFNLGYRLPRGSLTTQYVRSDDEFQAEGRREQTNAITARWQHQLSRRASAGFGLSWINEKRDEGKASDRVGLTPFFRYSLSRQTNLNVTYDFTHQGSTGSREGHTENRLRGSIVASF